MIFHAGQQDILRGAWDVPEARCLSASESLIPQHCEILAEKLAEHTRCDFYSDYAQQC